MLAPKTHCRGCEKRYPGCHGKCEDYKQARAVYDRQKAKERRDKELEADQFRRVVEAEKRSGRWRRKP